MLVDATPAEAAAIVRAMRDVATAGGTVALSGADRTAVRAAHHYVFRGQDELDVDGLAPIAPADLAEALVRERYEVPPLAQSDAAEDHPPAWYRPTA